MRPDEEMQRRWKHVEAYLRAALAPLERCEAITEEQIAEVEKFLQHNELGLAYDVVEELAKIEVQAAFERKAVAPYDARVTQVCLKAARAIMDLGVPS